MNCSSLTNVVIPNSVTTIGAHAFRDCTDLKNVVIPNSVTTIGLAAFCDCSGLTSIEIPNFVTTIADYTFSGCSGLTNVGIPNSVTAIGNSAFDGCATLKSINIPKSVTYMDYTSFSGCTGLREIYNYSETPQNMHSEKVESINTNKCMLYVPKGCFDIYDTDRYWGWFLNIVEFDATGINTVTNGDVQISVDGGAIVVNGVSDALPVTIYDINGKLVYSGTSKSVAVPANGVYIVKVAGVTKKVSL